MTAREVALGVMLGVVAPEAKITLWRLSMEEKSM